jgi:hypothetical protein
MKNFIRKSVIAVTLILVACVTTFQTNAKNSVFVYDRAVNSNINISSDNALGCKYEVKDSNGNIVLSGKITSASFNIPTAKLNKGTYHFSINGNILQQFAIK